VLVASVVEIPVGAQELPVPQTAEEIKKAEEAKGQTLELAPEAPPSSDDPFVAVFLAKEAVTAAALERIDATTKAREATLRALVAKDNLDQATRKQAKATKVRDAADAELKTERERLSGLTVRAYVAGGANTMADMSALLEGDTTDPAFGRELMFGQVLNRQEEVTEKAAADLRSARKKLATARRQRQAAKVESDRKMSAAVTAGARQTKAEAAHAEAIEQRDEAERRLRAASRFLTEPVPLETPLIGLPRLTAEDLTTWFEAKNYRPKIPTPIADIAKWFIEEGTMEGIRGDIAFAQAVLETGGFTNTDSVVANNYSGIGHYDNVPLGFIFASPQAGVRAQIQLLKGYAVKNPNYANPLVDKRLRGPAGCCQTWGDLTKVWATSPIYGPVVMGLYSSLVEHSLARRARGEGLATPAN
ncbi:MAG: glucosaminidase domain-containing protein, partial [Acidimicrobiales bacterium]|nr:glucosaminidase domain-containing protein [Acidimicrobiales bacterium]